MISSSTFWLIDVYGRNPLEKTEDSVWRQMRNMTFEIACVLVCFDYAARLMNHSVFVLAVRCGH